jgi:rhodanese-related sulfurtransferase
MLACAMSPVTTITPDALPSLMQSAAPHAVLDVRERGTHERGQIYRATSLPRRLLEWRLPGLVTAKRTPIVVYDDDGGRLATAAASTVRAMGYTDVRVLGGGLAAWRASGRRAVQGVNVPSKVFGERVLHEDKTPGVTPAELAAWIDAGKDMVIMDSRTPEEYARGCIPGSHSVPGGELVLRLTELVERPDTTIVVHCGGRTRSYVGAESVRRMNLPNPVVALENGTMGWLLAGLELERGATRWPPAPSAKSRAVASAVAKRVAAEDGVRFVTVEDLRALLARRDRENLYVLDVRTAAEYEDGHVKGAAWAPGGQVVQATDEYVAVRAAAVVLVCDGFVRSTMTASWLQRMGLPNVTVLDGGLPAWTEAGGEVETGHPPVVPVGYEEAARRVRAVAVPELSASLGTIDSPAVIDVEQSDAFARAHVPGARWICRSRLEWTIGRAAPDRARRVVVTSADGVQATLAAVTLAEMGQDARVLEGGTRAWRQAGHPVERGTQGFADEPDDVVVKPYDKGRDAMVAYLTWEEALDEHGWSPITLLPETKERT